jgi:hypothetical protein
MAFMEEVMKAQGGGIFISAVLGIGLASVFRRACVGGSCYVVRGPAVDHVTGHVWKVDDKCYRYVPEPAQCDGSETNVRKVAKG